MIDTLHFITRTHDNKKIDMSCNKQKKDNCDINSQIDLVACTCLEI